MRRTECTELDSALEQMWSEHREYLRRLLISLARDVDLAEDLLQETYLRARSGFSGYRGGDARAWLSTIARNAFYSHMRSRYVRSELPLDDREAEPSDDWPGSMTCLDAIELRRAVDALDPDLRTALIMKHYGGFTYKEIGGHLGCPTGTVQRRVWTAVQRLRSALAGTQKELAGMRCEELRGFRVLDYMYGTSPADRAAAVRAHLDACAECRREVEVLRGLMTSLDALDEVYKSTSIVEIDEHGDRVAYSSLSIPNPYDKPTDIVEFGAGPHTEMLHVFIQGEEVPIERLPTPDGEPPRYTAHLTRPLEPGGRLEMQFVFRQPCDPGDYLGDGRWRSTGQWLLTEKSVAILAVRLPCGASLISAEPEPYELQTNGATTVLWRRMMEPNEQLEITCEYRL